MFSMVAGIQQVFLTLDLLLLPEPLVAAFDLNPSRSWESVLFLEQRIFWNILHLILHVIFSETSSKSPRLTLQRCYSLQGLLWVSVVIESWAGRSTKGC